MAQNSATPPQTNDSIIVRAIKYKGDTIPYVIMPAFCIYEEKVFKSKRKKAKWTRLLKRVKKVYPLSILGAAKLIEYENVLATMNNEAKKKKYMKEAEDKIKAEFGHDLKQLTISEGRILIKLLDRQTGKTAHSIVKDMRGNFSAFMWQSLALMFNSNLKTGYDSEEDQDIEKAIFLIENGYF
jgi:hypothetical protein